MKFDVEQWGVILVVGTLVAAVLAVVAGVFLLADAVLASVPWWRRR
jgi:hypothetical protein